MQTVNFEHTVTQYPAENVVALQARSIEGVEDGVCVFVRSLTKMYCWNADSLATESDITVIKPSSLTENDPGRWIVISPPIGVQNVATPMANPIEVPVKRIYRVVSHENNSPFLLPAINGVKNSMLPGESILIKNMSTFYAEDPNTFDLLTADGETTLVEGVLDGMNVECTLLEDGSEEGYWDYNIFGSGTLTLPVSGAFDGSTTIRWSLTREGMVTLDFPSILGTITFPSTILVTSLPVRLRPSHTIQFPRRIRDNSANPTADGLVVVLTTSTIQIYKDLSGSFFASLAAEGGLHETSITYLINPQLAPAEE